MARLTMAGVSALLGLALAVSGLVVGLGVGLQGGSAEGSSPAAVAVAVVVTRGVIVLGMLAFGCGLIFFATRLLLGPAAFRDRDLSRLG